MRRYTADEIENILYHLNYRWRLQALAVWSGKNAPFKHDGLYEGHDSFLRLETLEDFDKIPSANDRRDKLRYTFLGHYLQRELQPYEAEMRTWMKGAAAHVDGRKIYWGDIIVFCQKDSTRRQRRIVQKETTPLCKFLRPFALNCWETLLDILKRSLGFKNYTEYCALKKQIDYTAWYGLVKNLLAATEDLYFSSMERWVRVRYDATLRSLTRFDAINLLGLTQFDSLLPPEGIEEFVSFFRHWGMDLERDTNIHIDLGQNPEKNPEAICFVLQVPEEIYVLMKPRGMWLDLEAMGHELGHALFNAHIADELPFVVKEISRNSGLTEAFAFLLQNVTMSVPFLTRELGLDKETASLLHYHKVLKDMSVFRRYAARFLSEYEMFEQEDLGNGERYAEIMAEHTGFYYQPEACLFDLAAEFYSLDYVLAWMAEAMLEEYFRTLHGEDWMFFQDTGLNLKTWWREGHRDDVFGFLNRIGLGNLSPNSLVRRWERALS